jgi:broad specificity phosphatase PhoE
MTTLALLRHAPTEWNAGKRLQGRADIGLSENARRTLTAQSLPADVAGFQALVSPLQRARETARLLGLAPTVEPRLIEMHWGRYEGRTVTELRAENGDAFTANEARGLDFTPEGGESPRMVQTRIRPLLVEIAAAARSTLAITHRGVIRAVYALATGWDMTGEAPHKLDLYAMQVFTLDAAGRPSIASLNRPLAQRRP